MSEIAHHCARIRGRPIRKLQQRSAYGHRVTLRGAERGDGARMGRRNLNDGLIGLYRHQRLAGDHVITRRDVPAHDLGALQSLPQVGQIEYPHQSNSIRARAAPATVSAPGM